MTGFDETAPPVEDPTEDAQATPEYEKETDQPPKPISPGDRSVVDPSDD